jgi:hypothetical protein
MATASPPQEDVGKEPTALIEHGACHLKLRIRFESPVCFSTIRSCQRLAGYARSQRLFRWQVALPNRDQKGHGCPTGNRKSAGIRHAL